MTPISADPQFGEHRRSEGARKRNAIAVLTLAVCAALVVGGVLLYLKADSRVEVLDLGLNAPAGIAADRAGSIFIADSGNGRILKMDIRSGEVATLPFVTKRMNGQGDVVVNATGDVYVSTLAPDSDEREYWLLPVGTHVPLKLPSPPGSSNQLSMAVAPDGTLYTTTRIHTRDSLTPVQQLVVLPRDSSTWRPLNWPIENLDESYVPDQLVVDIANKLYGTRTYGDLSVRDPGSGVARLVRTSITSQYSRKCPSGDHSWGVSGIAIDNVGDVIMSAFCLEGDNFKSEIWKVSPESDSLDVLSDNIDGFLTDVAVAADGMIYATDELGNRVIKLGA